MGGEVDGKGEEGDKGYGGSGNDGHNGGHAGDGVLRIAMWYLSYVVLSYRSEPFGRSLTFLGTALSKGWVLSRRSKELPLRRKEDGFVVVGRYLLLLTCSGWSTHKGITVRVDQNWLTGLFLFPFSMKRRIWPKKEEKDAWLKDLGTEIHGSIRITDSFVYTSLTKVPVPWRNR
jgi:hypothetical protein